MIEHLNDQLPNDEEEVAAEDHDGEEVVEDNDELNNDRQCGQQRQLCLLESFRWATLYNVIFYGFYYFELLFKLNLNVNRNLNLS